MGWHHQSTERNVHTPYRWTVSNEEERLAISTNADGSTITANDGLYCLCLQLNDNTTWLLSSVSPQIKWTQITNTTTERKSIAYIHAPNQLDYPFQYTSGQFTNIFMRRLAPNIDLNFSGLEYCKWDIKEYTTNTPPTVANEYLDKTFSSYVELIDFLNANLANTGTGGYATYAITLECYVGEIKYINPLKRIYGMNRFFSCIKGRDNYKTGISSFNYDASSWDNKDAFINLIYQTFLGTTPPPMSNAAQTIWFSKTFNKIYCHHRADITFPSYSNGRRYYHRVNSTTYSGVNGGMWQWSNSVIFSMPYNDTTVSTISPTKIDAAIMSGASIIRVSMYTSKDDSNKVAFLVKPVGMDMFHLGYHPDMITDNAHVFIEYRSPDSFPRIKNIGTLNLNNIKRQFGTNTSHTVHNADFIHILHNLGESNHLRNRTEIKEFRFFILTENGKSYIPTRWLKIYKGLPEVNLSILPKY